MSAVETFTADAGRARSLPKGYFFIDRMARPGDLVEMAWQTDQLNGAEQFVRHGFADRTAVPDDVIPERAIVERRYKSDDSVAVLGRVDSASVLIVVWRWSVQISVSAATEAEADAVFEEVIARVPKKIDPGLVEFRTWYDTQNGARSFDRSMPAPLFADARRNYPAPVQSQLEPLFALRRPTASGRLVLWHGPPGTGKTSAVRSLLREWKDWCEGQYIADPERFFGNPGYIAEVLTKPKRNAAIDRLPKDGDDWRIVIAEDCDEYLRATARHDAGAGLGRLLNLTDGILGQGFNTIVLLTTNEPVHRLHPAIVRPGRCLARVSFDPFTPAEAKAWLPDGAASPDTDSTLAELLERRGDFARIGRGDQEVSTGVYI